MLKIVDSKQDIDDKLYIFIIFLIICSEKDEVLFSYEISRQQQTTLTGWRRYLVMRDHLSMSPTVRLRTKTVKVNSDALLHN